MKKISRIAVAATLAFALLSTGNIALAESKSVDYDSNAKIKFKPNDDVTQPVDPENPDPENPVDPVDPTDPEGPNPGTPGPLSIDYASSFQFGEHKITSADETYYAAPQTYKNSENVSPLYVQVTDNRGLESGWSLSVVQNGQFETEAGQVLDGAAITVNNAAVESISNSQKPSQVAESFTLTPGAESTPLAAKNGEGAGTFTYRFGTSETADSSVELNVPGATTKYAQAYSTTLTWTLADTPANENK
ncbi:WxL domain-containing protein [Shouchella sp. 1P09AA]|uniref:WxL domain-containing protein n=1 Tax=unclassified Shouchella TaxID=2893065 RepID=UPI00399FD668